MTADRGHLVTDLPPDEEHAPRRRVTVEDLRARRDTAEALDLHGAEIHLGR